MPEGFNREHFRGENIKITKQLEVHTFFQQQSNSQEENHIMENASASVGSSGSSEGRDFYLGVKKRIKNNIRLQKSMLRKMRWIFMVGLAAGLALGLVNSFWFVTQRALAFSASNRALFFRLNQEIGRFFSLGFMSSFYSTALQQNDLAVLPQNLTNLTRLNSTFQASLDVLLTDLTAATSQFSSYWDPTSEAFYAFLRNGTNFHMRNNVTLHLPLLEFFGTVILFLQQYQTANLTLTDLNAVLQANFHSFLHLSTAVEQELDREYSASFTFYQLFQTVTDMLS